MMPLEAEISYIRSFLLIHHCLLKSFENILCNEDFEDVHCQMLRQSACGQLRSV